MDEGQSKSIRFRVAVDDQSFAKFKLVMQEMKAQVEQLAQSLGKIGGGGLFAGTNKVGEPGTPNSAGAASVGGTKPPGAIGGDVADSLTKVLVANKNLLKGVATESKEVSRIMRDAVKDSLEKQTEHVKKLRDELKGLAKEYDRVKQASGGDSGSGYGARLQSRIQEEMATRGGVLGKAVENLQTLRGAAAPAGGGGFFGGLFGRGGGGPSMGGGLNSVMGFMGMPGMAGLGIGAGVTAAYGYLQQQFVARDAAEANEALMAPLDALRRRAAINQSFGNMGMSIRRNMASARGFANLTPREIRTIFGKETFDAMVTQAYQKSHNTGGLNELSSRIGDAIMRDKDAQSVQTMALERLQGDIPADVAQRAQQVFQQKMASMSVREQTYLNEYQGEIGSRLALQRAAGFGRKRTVLPNGQVVYGDDRAQLLGQNSAFYAGEIGGMMGGIRSSVGGRFSGFAERALGLQAAGLGNAVGLIGLSGNYGNAHQFLSTLSAGTSMSGRGGLVDVPVASQLGGLATQGIASGGFGADPTQALEGYMSVAAMLGGGIRSGSDVASGVAGGDLLRSGRSDALQQAFNVLAANKAAPGADLYTRNALMNLNTAEMTSILRGGSIPQALKDRNISREMVRRFASEQSKYFFSRYTPGKGQHNAVFGAVQGLRAHGNDLERYLESLGANGKTAKGRAIRDEQLRLLGGALRDTNQPGVTNDRAGAAMLGLTLSHDMMRGLSGGYVGDTASSADVEAKKGTEKAILDKEKGITALHNRGDIARATSDAAVKAANALDGWAQKFDGFSSKYIESTNALIEALDRNTVTRGGKVPPHNQPKGKPNLQGDAEDNSRTGKVDRAITAVDRAVSTDFSNFTPIRHFR